MAIKQKIKNQIKFPTLTTHNAVETRGIGILPYVPNIPEKLKSILLSHEIRTLLKPPQKFGSLPSSFKDVIEPQYRQDALYKINCKDCDQCYFGKTKFWFETQ